MLRKALLTVSVLLLLCGVELRAQSDMDDMDATARVFKPIVLQRNANLNFGSVTAGAQGGTVTIAQDGNRSFTGDIGLVTSGSGHSAANVTITAQEWTWIFITLPAATDLVNGETSLTLQFNPSILGENFTYETGILEMLIGGTVIIPVGTPVGTYTGTVDLSVVYN